MLMSFACASYVLQMAKCWSDAGQVLVRYWLGAGSVLGRSWVSVGSVLARRLSRG